MPENAFRLNALGMPPQPLRVESKKWRADSVAPQARVRAARPTSW
jgi:hypothetical protein